MDTLIVFLKAFVVGGLFCVAAQLMIDLTKLTPARILTGYVVGGVFLEAVGIYPYITEFAGCGATIPLTGFGSVLAKGVRRSVGEDGLIGVLTGGLTATALGITAAMFFGLLVALIFRSKPK